MWRITTKGTSCRPRLTHHFECSYPQIPKCGNRCWLGSTANVYNPIVTRLALVAVWKAQYFVFVIIACYPSQTTIISITALYFVDSYTGKDVILLPIWCTFRCNTSHMCLNSIWGLGWGGGVRGTEYEWNNPIAVQDNTKYGHTDLVALLIVMPIVAQIITTLR